MIFRFIKSVFVAVLSFEKALTAQVIKYISLNNKPCLARRTFIDLNSDQLLYYPFVVILYRYDGICNTLDDISDKLCVSSKTEDLNIKYLIWKHK